LATPESVANHCVPDAVQRGAQRSVAPLMRCLALTPFIPAQAGIQEELGPRFRGDERSEQQTPLIPAQAGIQSETVMRRQKQQLFAKATIAFSIPGNDELH